MITIIAAVSKNKVIGDDNKLIWHLPEDLKRFRKLTSGNVILMGRKTHLSIGKVLPNRLNIILSRDMNWNNPLGDNCVVCHSVEEVLERFKHRDIFIIGGSQIYREFLPYADEMELTHIDKEFKGDVYFPEFGLEWSELSKESFNNGEFDYHFIKYKRIK